MNYRTFSVLQVGKFFHPDKGGIESTTKAIFEAFLREGEKNDVLCFKRGKRSEKISFGKSFILKCGTVFQVASTPISIKFFYLFWKLRNNYDIVHIHVPNPLAAIALLLFPVKGKVLVHWHSDILTYKILYFFFRFFEHFMLKRADIILATTPVYIEESPILKEFRQKVKLLNLGTNENRFSTDAIRVEEIKKKYQNKKIVFSLGRYIYYKGFEYLIEAAQLLPDDYVVLIAGGGPLQEKYEQLIKDFKVQDKVFLVLEIEQEDLGNYYAASNVFCLPSCEKTEAFGIVLIEAMIFSKPIVATNIQGSGVPWVNVHNVTGLNVEVKNPKALAEAIVEINSKNYELYARNARKRYEQNFSDEEMESRLRNFYLQLLNVAAPVIKLLNREVI